MCLDMAMKPFITGAIQEVEESWWFAASLGCAGVARERMPFRRSTGGLWYQWRPLPSPGNRLEATRMR